MIVRRLVGSLKRMVRAVQALRPVRIRSGPAAGLRMDLRRTSAWYAHGDNELPVQEAMQHHLRTGQTALDVGANVGFFSLLAGRLVGKAGRVVAFEPVPENAEALARNARLNQMPQIEVIRAAVGETPGRLRLNLTSHPGGAALASRGAPGDATGSLEVDVLSLDHLLESGRLSPPDFIKIDVEGAELEVLRGAQGLLRRHHPIVITEFDGPTPEAVRPRVEEASTLLRSLGYGVQPLARSYAGQWEVVHLLAAPGKLTM